MVRMGSLKELEWQQVEEKVKRKTFTAQQATFSYNCLEKGHKVVPHKHIQEQIVMMIAGEGYFVIEEKKYPVLEGSWIVIPSMAEHYFVANAEEPIISLDVFVPARPEIL